MRAGFIAFMSLALGACTGDKEGNTDVAELGCTETPDELSIEEESPLGFAGRAITTIAGGDHTADLTYSTGDTTGLTLSVTYQDGDIRFIDSEVESVPEGEEAPAIMPECPDRLEVDVRLEASTDDGALAETWESTLFAYEEQSINVYQELDPSALSGTLDVASFVTATDYDTLTAWLSGVITVTDFSGEIAGQASGEEDCTGDDCAAWAENVSIATFTGE